MWPMIASLLASKLGQGQGDGNGGGMSIPNPIGSVFSELSNAAMRAGGKEPVQNQQLGQQIIQPLFPLPHPNMRLLPRLRFHSHKPRCTHYRGSLTKMTIN